MVGSIFIAALWLIYEMSIALLPALMIPFWIPVFVHEEKPVSPSAQRWMLVTVGVGMLTLLVLAGVYFTLR